MKVFVFAQIFGMCPNLWIMPTVNNFIRFQLWILFQNYYSSDKINGKADGISTIKYI